MAAIKKVLLTGASGFIGYHCIRPLVERGYEVHAVTGRSMPADAEREGVIWHQVDIMHGAREILARIEPSHMMHLAWHVVPGQFASTENFAWVHASMDLLRQFSGKRALVCGSGYEYDWNYGYCVEATTPLKPNTVYGSCKHALYTMATALAGLEGFSLTWGRVFFVYGPRENPDRLVSSVIRSLLKGEPAKCSHGRQVRDYMHVQDVANGLVATLDSPIEGAVNVCSGQANTLRDMVFAIADIVGRRELIQLGAIPARANDADLVVGRNTRLVSEAGWQQIFELQAGLQNTIDWWKQVL